MVERCGLGRVRRAHIVVHSDGVNKLGLNVVIKQVAAEAVDDAHSQVHVPEQLTLARGRKTGRTFEFGGSSDVVKERGGDEQFAPKAGVKLAEIATYGGHGHRVLEQAARVSVVAPGRGREASIGDPQPLVVEKSQQYGVQSSMTYLGCQEFKETVEFAKLPASAREQRGRINVVRRLDRADIELESLPVSLDPAKHSDRVAELEPRSKELDVIPYAPVDPTGGVDEL